MSVEIPDLVENFDVSAGGRARRLPDRRLINFVNGFDLFRAADKLEQITVATAFAIFQLLDHCRKQHVVQQGRFSRPGNSSDDRKPVDRETNIDIFQIVRARAVDLDPILDRAQRSPRFSGRVTKRRSQTSAGLGELGAFDIAQRSGGNDLPAMRSRARAKINNVISTPHRFVIVLDDDE